MKEEKVNSSSTKEMMKKENDMEMDLDMDKQIETTQVNHSSSTKETDKETTKTSTSDTKVSSSLNTKTKSITNTNTIATINNTCCCKADVKLAMEEFLEDANANLGRANGNIYQRKPPVKDKHDGQIMVRLKRKRFIVIDYDVVPTPTDIAAATVSKHIGCPIGAGRQTCITPTCAKIGVPVMLYDSDTEQPASLYLRSGLCFTCQRNLNEKRRTQRKKKGTTGTNNTIDSLSGCGGKMMMGGNGSSFSNLSPLGSSSSGALGLHHGYDATTTMVEEPPTKRFKLNGEILELGPDAIIINGPIEGTKHHGHGYGYKEITSDLQRITREAYAGANHLSISLSSSPPAPTEEQHSQALALYQKTFLKMSQAIFLLSQWKSSWDEALLAAAAVAVESQTSTTTTTTVPQPPSPSSNDDPRQRPPPSMSNSLLMDSSAIASADALASAAAVAAVQSATTMVDTHPPQNSKDDNHHHPTIADGIGGISGTASSSDSNGDGGMIPLLLAAEAKDVVKHIKKELKKEDVDGGETGKQQKQKNTSTNTDTTIPMGEDPVKPTSTPDSTVMEV